MKVVECPDILQSESLRVLHDGSLRPSIFLAGGISGCDDWQKEMIQRFKEQHVTLINPRRRNFDITNPTMSSEQIEWEHDHLERANAILFWFPFATLCPITLFELGKYAAKCRKTIFVGCHSAYARKFDVEKQLSLIRPEIVVHDNFQDLVDEAVDWLSGVHRAYALT